MWNSVVSFIWQWGALGTQADWIRLPVESAEAHQNMFGSGICRCGDISEGEPGETCAWRLSSQRDVGMMFMVHDHRMWCFAWARHSLESLHMNSDFLSVRSEQLRRQSKFLTLIVEPINKSITFSWLVVAIQFISHSMLFRENTWFEAIVCPLLLVCKRAWGTDWKSTANLTTLILHFCFDLLVFHRANN